MGPSPGLLKDQVKPLALESIPTVPHSKTRSSLPSATPAPYLFQWLLEFL